MFASTQDLEFVQGQSRDVPDRELVLNNTTFTLTGGTHPAVLGGGWNVPVHCTCCGSFKMFNISAPEFGTMSMLKRTFYRVTEGVVHGVYKVVNPLC